MTDAEPRTTDHVCRAMARPARRRLLLELAEHNPQQAVPPLEAFPADSPPSERLDLELYHLHLPMLAAMGFIRWDRDTNELVRGPRFADIEPMLAAVIEHADAFDSA